jgi:hypothetical protein
VKELQVKQALKKTRRAATKVLPYFKCETWEIKTVLIHQIYIGQRGSVVVKATNRKVAGSIPDEVYFYIHLNLPILPVAVYWASNRNEYQKHKNNNVSGV